MLSTYPRNLIDIQTRWIDVTYHLFQPGMKSSPHKKRRDIFHDTGGYIRDLCLQNILFQYLEEKVRLRVFFEYLVDLIKQELEIVHREGSIDRRGREILDQFLPRNFHVHEILSRNLKFMR